jgi:DNA-binding MarR family transcriptional regulator
MTHNADTNVERSAEPSAERGAHPSAERSATPNACLIGPLEEGLTRTFRVFRRILKEEADARELSQAQYNALRQLAQEGEQRMSELAGFLELSNGATTGLVERLEARGLVARAAAPGDGRGVVVRLTPAGQGVVDAMHQAIQRAIAGSLERLSLPERHMAVGGLHALAVALEEVSGG